jgi:hypothetical protein
LLVFVLDAVLQAVEREIAVFPPERGAALLGPRGRPLVTHLVPDPEAASASAYRPSRALDARVKALEREEGLALMGIVHSHPAGLESPSGQDAAELGEGLRRNGHMPFYLAPIVTRRPDAPVPGDAPGTADALLPDELPMPEDEVPQAPARLAAHEVALPSGKIAFHAGFRAGEGAADVRTVAVRVVPLLRDAERVGRLLGAEVPEILVALLGDVPAPAARLSMAGLELLVVATELYPAAPPVVLATDASGATEEVPIAWRLATAEEDRLAEALSPAVVPPGPYAVAYGPPSGPALTRDAGRARVAGWERRFTGEDPGRSAERLREALFARSAGLVTDALGDRAVLVAGCGSVGSYVAEALARSGVGGLALVDPEPVEAANLSRTVYEALDVGAPKVEALARRLLGIQPALRLELRAEGIEGLEPAALDALVRGADLVVAATDDPAAQRALNRFAYGRGKPALFVGLYAKAEGGEVVVTVPERTACYLCATRTRAGTGAAGGGNVARAVDYGTARLRGEMALGADIQHVASAAVKLGLSLLLPPGSGAALSGFAEGAIAAGTSFLTLSTVPEYWFYPHVFGETPGQGAYQSVWLTPSRAEECPVCGAPPARRDPLEAPLRTPSREAFEELLRRDREA